VEDDETQRTRDVRLRADLAGVPLRPEDVPSVVLAWRLIEPHLTSMTAARLPPSAEPAPLFRP
jgi:hypothetical protein